ncbi:MAG: 16S rRNA (guanine(527)-N(7))-methyltransferase RsmG [Campylobacter sp.]|nr:16S rRNA (guanine(527)-N(7))-methyltransferase RsmG [Campylobacter sp.]
MKFDQTISIYKEILNKFNKIHNLTRYEDIDSQINDSIAGLEILGDFAPKTAIDVGSGAGFPAIFLALKMPNCKWYLFEPNSKKASFLSYAKIHLDLQNVKVYAKKIQDQNKFVADLITSRALAKTSDLLEICKGFYNEDSKILLYKGSSVLEELQGLNAKIFNKNNRNFVLLENLC